MKSWLTRRGRRRLLVGAAAAAATLTTTAVSPGATVAGGTTTMTGTVTYSPAITALLGCTGATWHFASNGTSTGGFIDLNGHEYAGTLNISADGSGCAGDTQDGGTLTLNVNTGSPLVATNSISCSNSGLTAGSWVREGAIVDLLVTAPCSIDGHPDGTFQISGTGVWEPTSGPLGYVGTVASANVTSDLSIVTVTG